MPDATEGEKVPRPDSCTATRKPLFDDLVGGSGLPLHIGYFDTMGIEPPFSWLVGKRKFWCQCLLRFDRRRGVIQQNAVDLHGMVNILELVLTKILEGDAETAFRVFLHSARHADAAGFCQRL